MNIEYKKISEYDKGTLLSILEDAYSYDSRFAKCFYSDWESCDDFFYENIQIGDKYCFISTIDNKAVGFICWDPRNMPSYAEIGHNCVLTEYKGLGIGRLQLQEAIRRIVQNDVEKIIVTTNEALIPAQRNYEKRGFKLLTRRVNDSDSAFSGDYLDYEYWPAASE